MNTRIYNAKILTMQPDQNGELPIFCGEIHTEMDHISYIGLSISEAQKNELTFDREINAQGNLIMPGFKNAHTHSAMTFLRSYADDLPLQDWLNKQVFPMEAKLTDDDVYWCSRLAILEYLTSGITANFDMYAHKEAIAQASMDSGFRTVLCGHLNNFVSSLPDTEADYVHFNQLHPLISYQLGFHAEYTTDRKLLEGIAALSQKFKAPVYTHSSETKKEVEECIGRYGFTPISLMNHLGMLDYGGGGYHCVYMTEEDLEICRDKKIWVITNPGSNAKLASGIAPLMRMLQMNIGLAIGTDGPASNNCLDMFREMFLATALQKLSLSDASAMDANEVLKMAVNGGARAMCLPDCDFLSVGKKADLIMIDLHQPNMQPLNHLTHNLVYSGSKQNVILTMVNGQILYENGTFYVNVDPEEIYAKANECIQSKKGASLRS